MNFWMCGIIAAAVLIILILLVRLFALKSSVRRIADEFNEITGDDTNILISVWASDKAVLYLIRSINRELASLRDERRRLQNGDIELKKAVTNIAHDIRTPLTAISGYLDLLDCEEKSDDANEYLSVIRERTNALRALTEELFQYSVITSTADALVTEETDLVSVLEENLVTYYGIFCEKKIVPQIELANVPVIRYLDRRAINRIIGNIISNAVKYSDGDFSVRLGTDGVTEFSNTARGLDEISVGRLFDRFYTVESGRTSTGLGLSIAKLLTERMGGQISARYCDDVLTIMLEFEEKQ